MKIYALKMHAYYFNPTESSSNLVCSQFTSIQIPDLM
jgi:hypothetical protein